MQDLLFEYAVMRIVPRVEREEFINAGVILYCSKTGFLQAMYKLDERRLKIFCEEADAVSIRANLDAVKRICMADSQGGPIAKLDLASRFRWLTATRSTVVQCSKVHPGFCIDPLQKLEELYRQLVF